MHVTAVIAVRVFFTVIMGYGGVVDLSKVSKGISKVPIMAPKNALLGMMEIKQYNTRQCVVWNACFKVVYVQQNRKQDNNRAQRAAQSLPPTN